MIPSYRLDRVIHPDALKRIHQMYLEGYSVEAIRERFGLSRKQYEKTVKDLPKREKPKAKKVRTTMRIPQDLTT